MPKIARFLPSLLLVFLALAPAAPADERSAYEERVRPGHCPCEGGQACWHYLRAPMRIPNDACRCGLCAAGGECSAKPRPKGASAACWGSPREECFWKRHAYSWKVQCRTCWADEACDACDDLIGGRSAEVRAMLDRQHEVEGGARKNRNLWVAVTPHFYVVTDIDKKLKVPVRGGAPRTVSGHEFVHLYAQRCEQAYEDFAYWFGGRVQLARPMAIYLFQRKSDKEAVAGAYFGGQNTSMIYGGGTTRIAQGFAGNGFAGSLEDQRTDENLHAYCRHMIGHILFSCWIIVNGFEKYCPIWAFVGAALFMERMLPEHKDCATFCSNETVAPTGSTKDWDKRAATLATRRLDPVETFFARESLGRFSYEDRIRAWSYMDLMLREDRAPWLETLAGLRRGEDEGPAFKAGLGITPDQFHERWVERLTGRRRSMATGRGDAEDDDAPGRRERRRIETEQDPDVLAGLVRGVNVVVDVRMAKAVLGRLDHPSDAVRESIYLVLSRTTVPEVRAFLRTEGLKHASAEVRAGVARALGRAKDAEALEAIAALLADKSAVVRAEAAWALQALADPAALPALEKALEERDAHAWIAATDAFASFGQTSPVATARIVPRLSDRHWQVRLTAARALARVGTEDAIGPLIDRFDTEGGRLAREFHAALKVVTRDDLGVNPGTWRRWWEQQKKDHGGLGPQPETVPNPADERYANPSRPGPGEPTYYGRRIFSRSVAFVLDTSGSMGTGIAIGEADAARLGGLPLQSTRFLLAKQVLTDALRNLDPRTRLSLVFFSTEVQPWKNQLVPASPGNVQAAISAVSRVPAEGETNIHGALKAVLGLHGKRGLRDVQLDPIPDTVYFLTDGSPTRGEITDADTLLSWFGHLNRTAKVEMHVIALGNLGVDIGFLRRLAEAGGGEFVHVPER